jgi:N-acetylglucosaminyldiphosphoundecaprenol N-acetyl-beta-D-mannosaminyltransferase
MYVNAHVLNQSQERPELRAALEGADLVYCDGYGVRVAARALGVEEPHRMTGADWVWGLASICEADGISLYLLGSEPGAAREAARRLRRWHPDLDVVGAHHGYFEATQRPRARGHQRVPPEHPARGHGEPEAGAVGRPLR